MNATSSISASENQKALGRKINKDKVALLAEQGIMAEAGLLTIEIAKKNGSWTKLDEVEESHPPPTKKPHTQCRVRKSNLI